MAHGPPKHSCRAPSTPPNSGETGPCGNLSPQTPYSHHVRKSQRASLSGWLSWHVVDGFHDFWFSRFLPCFFLSNSKHFTTAKLPQTGTFSTAKPITSGSASSRGSPWSTCLAKDLSPRRSGTWERTRKTLVFSCERPGARDKNRTSNVKNDNNNGFVMVYLLGYIKNQWMKSWTSYVPTHIPSLHVQRQPRGHSLTLSTNRRHGGPQLAKSTSNMVKRLRVNVPCKTQSTREKKKSRKTQRSNRIRMPCQCLGMHGDAWGILTCGMNCTSTIQRGSTWLASIKI